MLKIFHPRRRRLFIRIFGAFTILGFLFIIWWKRTEVDSRGNMPPPFEGNEEIKNEKLVEIVEKRDANVVIEEPAKLLQEDEKGKEREFSSDVILELERQLQEDAKKYVPGSGEGGKGVRLEGKEKELADELMKKEAFSIIASDKISLNRSVPDNRHPSCKGVVYDEELPTASVVIIFTNEAWSPLIRTVWSVLNRSPDKHLHEIILLDDFSDRDVMLDKLTYYVQRYLPKKVKLIRSKERLGLIRARIEGARAATGDVLIFLDSHCEATEGWLQPLLQRIKENRNAFLLPIIDVISDDNMEFYGSSGLDFQVGGFSWSGHFTWILISKQERERRGSVIAPTRSPTMAGGLFAVDRKYFWELGGYDEGMEVWGGENLEISFRIWMCGGVLESIPCSHVGHIFRSFHPYTFPGNKDTHGINTVRMAEVWMDDYKRLFYMHRHDLKTIDYGDVQPRKDLRKKLKCTSFKWYLDNIYPEKFIPDENVLAYGRVRNPNTDFCLDTLQKDEKQSYDIGLYPCHNFMATSQLVSLSLKNEFRREDGCAEVPSSFPENYHKVKMTRCSGVTDQKWKHERDGQIIHESSGACLDVHNSTSLGEVWVNKLCSKSRSQLWTFDIYL